MDLVNQQNSRTWPICISLHHFQGHCGEREDGECPCETNNQSLTIVCQTLSYFLFLYGDG